MSLFSDIEKYHYFWQSFSKKTKELKLMNLATREKGLQFENIILKTLADVYGYKISLSSDKNKHHPCRGGIKHQFDILFTLNDIKYIGECKYSEDKSQGSSYFKTGIAKFAFNSFQRVEYLRKLQSPKEERSIFLIYFTNYSLNKSILTDCFLNNIIFINPEQPYTPLAIYLFDKLNKSKNIFENKYIYDTLLEYTNYIFAYKNILKNTLKIDESFIKNYVSFIENNQLKS